jgi:hypothetical protein
VQHHYEGHWKGWALKIETFLGPDLAQAKGVPFGPKKVEIFRAPSNAPSNDVAPLKTIKYKRHKNNWYIGSFMYPSALVVCCCVFLCVRGVVRSPCSCVVEEVFRGWGVVGRPPLPPPTIV